MAERTLRPAALGTPRGYRVLGVPPRQIFSTRSGRGVGVLVGGNQTMVAVGVSVGSGVLEGSGSNGSISKNPRQPESTSPNKSASSSHASVVSGWSFTTARN